MAKGFSPNQGQHYADGIIWLGQQIQSLFRTASVTVTTTAGKIPDSPLSKRKSLSIINISSNIVYIGDASVTVATGFPLYPRAVLALQIEDNVDVYGIAASSSELRIFEGA